MRSVAWASTPDNAMPWPFSRSETTPPGDGPAEAGGRQEEAKDPAAELRAQTRRRLIGAALLLLGAVIVLPMLLDTVPRPVPDDITITVATPAPALRPPADKSPAVDERIAEPAPVSAEPAPVVAPSTAAKSDTPAQARKPATPVQSAVASAPADKFVLQVAALSTPAAADELRARLTRSGFVAYVEAVATGEGKLHRVRVGPFASRDDALRAAEKLKAAGHRATLAGG